MNMDPIEYRIHGSDLQYVEVRLAPGRCAVSEPGAMMYVDDDVQVSTEIGDGSGRETHFLSRLWRGVRRKFSGESLFTSIYRNDAATDRRVAFAAPGPGQIVPIDLAVSGGTLIVQRGAFLAGARGVEVGLAWQKRIRVGLFGGEGFIMQKLTGNGVAFVHASGALTEMQLAPGQSLRVDTGCLVALQSSVRYDIKYAGKIKTALFGGEGLFFAQLSGPGTIWLQSMPLKRLSRTLLGMAATANPTGRIGWFLVIIAVAVINILTMDIPV
ncbi:TIGR00266 family protein [Nevskia ramosa]|uniref:TIGR00266 family protein n=1 Tax=Nevskia ramosa TaxID=64002 RepID=UPI0003B6D6B6|nr:TIGR00266 family protein [Nevskia ramosa]